MMDIKALDTALQEIAKLRVDLSKIDYNNPDYDDLEEKLHDVEDDFQDEYGDYLEEILQTVHDQIAPDTDVLHPIAYVAKTYTISSSNEFAVDGNEGVYVEVDKMPGKETKLVLIPNPLRVILLAGENQEIVWSSK